MTMREWYTGRHESGWRTGVHCPLSRCDGEVLYNGNYFCSNLTGHWRPVQGECSYAMDPDHNYARDREVMRQVKANGLI